MRRSLLNARGEQGIALLELMVSMIAAAVVVGGLLSATVAIRRSITATDQYATSAANETRLMDYVARDLRQAVRVGMLNGSTTTPLKNYSNFALSSTNLLVISIPDYYAANTPNNAAGSSYKTTRYPRSTLNTSATYNSSGTAKTNGIVPWAEAATTLNGKGITRFAPTSAGTGEIQIRYYRGTRSSTDATPCFFRAEYPSGASTPSEVREVAERIADNLSTASLTVTGLNNGLLFRLQADFTPRYRRSGSTVTGTDAFVEVSTRNARRD